MIDSASINAIADKTKTLLDAGQNLAYAITALVTAVSSVLAYMFGHRRGKKAGTK